MLGTNLRNANDIYIKCFKIESQYTHMILGFHENTEILNGGLFLVPSQEYLQYKLSDSSTKFSLKLVEGVFF